MDTPAGFVGVHIGAGQHSEARTPLYLSICSQACARAVQALKEGRNALDAATEATKVLEDAGETNAGFGSNLTEKGTVEMDAGVMDGASLLFGGVGAMPDVRNPVEVARLLVREQERGLLPLGRVPPVFLAGAGARDWAVQRGVETVPAHSLVSEKAAKLFKHYKKKLDMVKVTAAPAAKSAAEPIPVEHDQLQPAPQTNVASDEDLPPNQAPSDDRLPMDMVHGSSAVGVLLPEDDSVTDTVGVVVMDSEGNVASTVSSGGIALKQPGRVGQASCFGCGCWAQNASADRDNQSSDQNWPRRSAVAVSTTGCGEHLMRTFLARECATVLSQAAPQSPLVALKEAMTGRFAQSEFLRSVPEKLGGAICLTYDPMDKRGCFLWTHTTSSMGLAYQTTEETVATTRMSRLPPSKGDGHGKTTILVESFPFQMRRLRKRKASTSWEAGDAEETVGRNGTLATNGGST
jgi:taspase (threonine aspartase 1)